MEFGIFAQLSVPCEISMVVVGDPDDCAKAVHRWVDIEPVHRTTRMREAASTAPTVAS